MSVLDDPKYVTVLHPCDVLFGRGSGPNDHEGNIRFRKLVAERKSEYMATNHRLTKANIAREIVNQVFAVNGRFMKKVEPAELSQLGLPEGSDVWEVVGDDTIMEKAKQALRQNAQKNGKDENGRTISPIPSSPRSRSPRNNRSPVRSGNMEQSRQLSLDLDELEPIPLAIQRQNRQQGFSRQFPAPVPSWDIDGRIQQRNPAMMHSMAPNSQQNEGSMLSHVRQSSYAKGPAFNDASMANLPQEDVPVRGRPAAVDYRRDMAPQDASRNRRNVVDMHEMTDSFNRLRTNDRNVMNMHNSVETMGTIEPINTHGSVADMSLAMMGSSTFSFLPGNDSVIADADLDEKIAQVEAEAERERRGSRRPPQAIGASITSVNSAQLSNMSIGSLGLDMNQSFQAGNQRSMNTPGEWGNRRTSATSVGPHISSLFASKDLPPIDAGDEDAYEPRPVGSNRGVEFESFDMGTSFSHLKSTLSLNEGPQRDHGVGHHDESQSQQPGQGQGYYSGS